MALLKPVKIDFFNGQLRVKDYTNFTTYPASTQTVTVTLPGAATGVVATNLSYYVLGETANPMLMKPASVGLTGTVFPDGLYRVEIDQVNIDNSILEADERFLYIPAIDECILKKTDSYLQSTCKNCQGDAALTLLQELVVLRQAAFLDVNFGRFAEAALKVNLLTNLCTGASCTCICGC